LFVPTDTADVEQTLAAVIAELGPVDDSAVVPAEGHRAHGRVSREVICLLR
jgi:hypothetical protein